MIKKIILIFFSFVILIGCGKTLESRKNEQENNKGILQNSKKTDSKTEEKIKPADRKALQDFIKQVRQDKKKIEEMSLQQLKASEESLSKEEVIQTLKYASDLTTEETQVLQHFDELTGWNDKKTINALDSWNNLSLIPILNQSQPYGCGSWQNGQTCHTTLVVPTYNQILKLDPILEHGLNRLEIYLKQ